MLLSIRKIPGTWWPGVAVWKRTESRLYCSEARPHCAVYHYRLFPPAEATFDGHPKALITSIALHDAPGYETMGWHNEASIEATSAIGASTDVYAKDPKVSREFLDDYQPLYKAPPLRGMLLRGLKDGRVLIDDPIVQGSYLSCAYHDWRFSAMFCPGFGGVAYHADSLEHGLARLGLCIGVGSPAAQSSPPQSLAEVVRKFIL